MEDDYFNDYGNVSKSNEDVVEGLSRPTKKPRSKARQARLDREERHARGEFFDGATTHIPRSVFNPIVETPLLRSVKWVDYIHSVGQRFEGGAKDFRDKLIKFAAKVSFQFDYVRNDSCYVNVDCKKKQSVGCNWFVRAALDKVTETFVLRKAHLNHSCSLSLLRNDSKRLGQGILGNICHETVRAQPTMGARAIQKEILKHWGIPVNYEKV